MVCYPARPAALYGQRSVQYGWQKVGSALALTKKELILLPLYPYQHQMHHANRVQGYQLNYLGWVNFKDIWFDDGCSAY